MADSELPALLSELSVTSPSLRPTGDELDELSNEISRLFDTIYEIEELRHSSSASSSSSLPRPATRLDTLLSTLESSIASLGPRIESAISKRGSCDDEDAKIALDQLDKDWARLSGRQALLKQEMKEDGWLVRFRTTADQAEAMMDTLRKSLMECSSYLDHISSSAHTASTTSEYDDQPSLHRLLSISRSHESLKITYVPSVTKILKLMNKSISNRPTKNGEALRRYGEMTDRWTTLSRQLQQLDARLHLTLSQTSNGGEHEMRDVEVLVDPSSPISPPMGGDYFAMPSKAELEAKRPPSRARQSFSSSVSSTSRANQNLYAHAKPRLSQPTLTPDQPRLVRRSSSSFSAATSKSAEKPRWNISTKPPPVPAIPADYQHLYHTPTSRHIRSTSRAASAARIPLPTSPTPSTLSLASSARPSDPTTRSRIPVLSPKRDTSAGSSLPALAVSTTQGQIFLSNDNRRRTINANSTTEGEAFRTPTKPRPSMPATLGSQARTPALAPRQSYSRNGTAPRTAPPRQSLARAPPSSYRSMTPTPDQGLGTTAAAGAGPTPSRPSSRLSNASHAQTASGTNMVLTPFQPSKYDLLDAHVASLLEKTQFDLFVARLDPPLKQGQRRRDDEEWKGEYVFGAGERSTSVKLLKLAGRQSQGGEQVVKCLVRVGGAWVELERLLRERMAAMAR